MNRINILDFIRGIAVIFMIFNHYFSLIDAKLGTKHSNNFLCNILGFVSRIIFIFLLGFSYKLSQNNKNFNTKLIFKILQLIFYSLLINIITFFIYPDNYVRFGILHFLSLSLFLLTIFSKIHFSFPLFIGLLLFLYISLYLLKIHLIIFY